MRLEKWASRTEWIIKIKIIRIIEVIVNNTKGLDLHYIGEASAIIILWTIMGWGLFRIYAGFSLSILPCIILGIIIGYLAADFLSGLVHWFADRYGSPQTPIVGPTFITPFREHHADPKDITRVDFIMTNGHNSMITIPVLLMFNLLPIEGGSWWAILIFTSGLSLSLWGFATNQFHKWAHLDNPSRLARVLQKVGISLHESEHNKHHAYPNDSNYCITSGVLNGLLDKIQFWIFMEKMMLKVFNASPFHDDDMESHIPLTPSK